MSNGRTEALGEVEGFVVGSNLGIKVEVVDCAGSQLNVGGCFHRAVEVSLILDAELEHILNFLKVEAVHSDREHEVILWTQLEVNLGWIDLMFQGFRGEDDLPLDSLDAHAEKQDSEDG